MNRPSHFELDYSHPLARGLVFAGLGNAAGGNIYCESSAARQQIAFTSNWSWAIGRPVHTLDGTSASTVELSEGVLSASYPATLAIWIKSTGFVTDTMLHVGTNGVNGFSLRGHGAGGQARIEVRDSVNGSDERGGSTSIIDGEWHHVCGVYLTDALRRLYVDGRLDGEDTTSLAVGNDTWVKTTVGSFPHNTTYTLDDESVADPMIWNRVLADAEILQLAGKSNTMLSGLIREPGKVGDIYNLEGVR